MPTNFTQPISLPAGQRVALLLEYNGGAYHGSQLQCGQVTVQGELIQALHRLNVQPTAMMMAGRTDTGVHAKGQVVHFDIAEDALQNIDHLRISLNALLPATLCVRDLKIGVDPRFHAQHHGLYKWYRYQIYLAPDRSVWTPFDSIWVNPVHRPLDIDRMQAAAQLIRGKHHFKSFQCPDTHVTDDVCDIMIADFHQETAKNGEFPGKLLIFDIVGDRFV